MISNHIARLLTNNIDRRQGRRSRPQKRDKGTGGMRKQMHATQGRCSRNGICDCHERRVQGVRDAQDGLDTNHIGKRKRRDHTRKGWVRCDRSHCQERSGCDSNRLSP